MTAGCVGLIAAAADIYPSFREEITAVLDRTGASIAPWDLKDRPSL